MPTLQQDDQDTKYNPAQELYEREFGSVGTDKKDTHVDTHGDTVQNNPNADIHEVKDKEESGGSETSLYKSGIGKGDTLSGMFKGKGGKKIGPTGGVVALMLFALLGVGGGTMSLGASLIVNLKEIFHNDRSDATRTNRLFSRAYLAHTLNNQDKDCTGSKIKCKISGWSKERMKSYKERGFKVFGTYVDANGKDTGKKIEDDKSLDSDDSNKGETKPETTGGADDRGRVTAIEFPDGTRVTSGKDFYTHADSDPRALRSSELAFASRASFYTNKFFSKVLGDKWKFSKAKKAFPDGEKKPADENDPNKKQADPKEAQDKAFNEQTDGLSSEDKNGDGIKKHTTRVTDDAGKQVGERKGGGKSGAIISVVQAMCQAYKLARGAVTAVKIYQTIQLGKFALMFLQAADEIKDGRGGGPKTTYLSDNLTSYESNEKTADGKKNPKYNLNAMDSQGYKVAAHGDTGKLTDFAKKYLLGGNGTIKSLDTAIKTLDDAAGKIPGTNSGRSNMKAACRMMSGDVAGLIAGCAGVTSALTTITASGAGVGAIIGAAFGITACACTAVSDTPLEYLGPCKSLNDLAQKIKEGMISYLKNGPVKDYIAKVLKEVSVGSDTKGVDAGNAIAAGVGLVLSATSTGYGLKPSSKDGNNQDITNYITYTQPLENTYIALEKEDARNNPLDATNQYSLLGNVVRSLNVTPTTTHSFFGNLSILSSLLPTALSAALTGKTASALYNQPSTASNTDRYKECNDDDLKDINATGDKFCSIVGVTPVSELKAASNQVEQKDSQIINTIIEWMSNKQPETEDKAGIDEDCTNTDGSEADCDVSKQPSINKDTGEPTKNSQYDKYLTYCTDLRKNPWGAQSEAYEQGTDRDQDWYSGKQCMKSGGNKSFGSLSGDEKMLTMFRMWTNICLQAGTADGATNCYQNDATNTESSAEKNTGAWVIPTSGECFSGFGQRGGALHAGIDISPPQGTPIVAPTSMKIISAGDKSDGYGYSVVARATDGTNHMFRFGHMVAQPPVKPGQEVSKGTLIGNVGSTGDSSGPHLHFEIYDPSSPDGAYASNGKPVDPVPILKQHGVDVGACRANS